MQGTTTVTRRHVLTGAGLAATLVTLSARAQEQVRSTQNGFRILRARPGRAHLHGPDRPATDVWGYDGVVPGPVLRARRGEEVRVRLINELSEETTLHWHGVRLPNALDGVPHLTQVPVAPGASFDYRFTARDAGTFWYHPHLGATGQLDRGLSGALVIEESEPVEADRDAVLILDDWRLAADATHVTVNGEPALDIPVKANERFRIRLINAARADAMALRFDRHRATVMAIDGQPAEPFVARDSRVVLGPGNRLDLFIDLVLTSGANAPLVLTTGRGDAPIGRFVYESGVPVRAAPLPDPKPLPANPLPQRIELRNAHRVDLAIARGARPWTASGPYGPPLFSLKRGRTVVLGLINRTEAIASLHLHGHSVRLLDNLDDGWKPFWLDTLMVPAQQTARIAFVADSPGKWLVEAQMLQLGDTAMGAWFEVT